MNTVAFEWALRDILQGRRAIGVAIATFVPALFMLLIWALEGSIPRDQTENVTAIMIIGFVMPPLVAVLSIIVGGTVLRGPLEDATAIYMLTRPAKRMHIGIARALAVAIVVALAATVAGVSVALMTGEIGLAAGAIPGLLIGGFALGAFYGFVLSLHRFAIGAVLVHAVIEASVGRVPFESITRYTISWHAWGGMGRLADVAVEATVLANDGGNVFVPLLMGALSLLLSGLLYDRRAFNLGVAEA